MNPEDARVWFSYRSKMTKREKGITSSVYRKNMNCRHCNITEEETHEYLEICPETAHLKIKLDIEKEHNHMVFRRKITRKLKEITAKEEHAKNI